MKTGGISLRELGIDKDKGQLNNYIDTHGSLGDGSTYIEIEFAGENADATEEELKDNKNWIRLPLTNNLQSAIYGDEETISLMQSFGDEIPPIPEISNGFYCFYDRHSESTDTSDDSELFSRYSFNFDILIYDMDEHILYIYQLDT
jgi:hypothetical protein